MSLLCCISGRNLSRNHSLPRDFGALIANNPAGSAGRTSSCIGPSLSGPYDRSPVKPQAFQGSNPVQSHIGRARDRRQFADLRCFHRIYWQIPPGSGSHHIGGKSNLSPRGTRGAPCPSLCHVFASEIINNRYPGYPGHDSTLAGLEVIPLPGS